MCLCSCYVYCMKCLSIYAYVMSTATSVYVSMIRLCLVQHLSMSMLCSVQQVSIWLCYAYCNNVYVSMLMLCQLQQVYVCLCSFYVYCNKYQCVYVLVSMSTVVLRRSHIFDIYKIHKLSAISLQLNNNSTNV